VDDLTDRPLDLTLTRAGYADESISSARPGPHALVVTLVER
jgi:hypothetical protein